MPALFLLLNRNPTHITQFLSQGSVVPPRYFLSSAIVETRTTVGLSSFTSEWGVERANEEHMFEPQKLRNGNWNHLDELLICQT
jgi:hypothetical protein